MDLGNFDVKLQEGKNTKILNDYINSRLEDIENYLSGINYKQLGAEYAVKGLRKDILDFFNKKKLDDGSDNLYRIMLDNFVVKVRNSYDNLKANGLWLASTEEEVEEAISKFELELKKIVDEFKDKTLNIFHNEDKEAHFLGSVAIDDIKVKIRKKNERISMNDAHKRNELYTLREVVSFVCAVMDAIVNKYNNLQQYKKFFEKNYTNGTPEYNERHAIYWKLRSMRNYDQFSDTFDYEFSELIKEVNSSRRR